MRALTAEGHSSFPGGNLIGTTISWLHDDAIEGVEKARTTNRAGSSGPRVLNISRPDRVGASGGTFAVRDLAEINR